MNLSVAHNLDNATLEDLQSPLSRVVLPLIYTMAFMISTPCNLLCFLLLCCRTKRKTSTIVLAINLSLADILYSISLPLQISYHLWGNDWHFGSAACSFTMTAFHCSIQCSVLVTCAIALERYMGVVHPITAKHLCTTWRAGLVCLLIWALALSMQVPLMRQDLLLRVEELGVTTCFDVVPRGMFGGRLLSYTYFGAVFLLFYALPLVIFIACYIAVTRKLHRSPQSEEEGHSRRYALIMCAVAAVCFVMFYLPNILLQVMHMIYRMKQRSLYRYYKLTHGLNSLNCCVDPFVYYLASREFRNTFRCCNRHQAEELSTPSDMASYANAPLTHTCRL